MTNRGTSLVKWSQNKYNLPVDASKPPLVFKEALQAITNIPTNKMKLLFKGKIISDTEWPANLPNNPNFMLLASAADVKPPAERVVFEEDLSHAQLAKAVSCLETTTKSL